MTPNQILKKTRVERKMSLEDMARVLDVTRARVFQWEKGEPIPVERISLWACNSSLPQWALVMGLQMWLGHMQVLHESNGNQLQALGRAMSEAC
jgi:transcriptional regulator with XRE-family HTH domain